MCARCLRAQTACICRWIAPVAPQASLLVLLHPLEAGNAKNSGRLLHLSVAGSALAVGETFDADSLDALLHAGGRTPVLLYPAPPDDLHLPAPPLLPVLPASALRLVVLDATWRKSRKMLYLNPGLQALPRLALQGDLPASRYGALRKAHAPSQLSTLEAAACALQRLAPAGPSLQPLRDALEGLLALHARHRPE